MSRERTPLEKAVDTADAIMGRVNPDMAPSEQEHGWTLDQAISQLDHLKLTSKEWQAVAAFLACQVWGARRVAGIEQHQAAQLALSQIKSALKGYEDRA